MNIISKARITDYNRIRKGFRKVDTAGVNFISEFNESMVHHIVMGNCYLVGSRNAPEAVIIIKNLARQVVYLPVVQKGISFFKLLYLLTKKIGIGGYILNIRYNNLKPEKYKKYFRYNVIEDIKIMKAAAGILPKDDFCSFEDITFRAMELGKDEQIRVELQNRIFEQVKGRRSLTLEEVKREEGKPSFIRNMCYIVEVKHIPAGYGQILFLDDKYYLVNFGITDNFRSKGLGYHFLNQILIACQQNGIDTVYLSVDNSNTNALMLYGKAGFRQEYNKLVIQI